MRFSMAKKQDFRPDRTGLRQLQKLWPTPLQQLTVLRWLLYGAVCLVGLLMQDVCLYRVDVAGGCTDVVPCLIVMVAVMRGGESGSVFALVMSVLYFFSGSAPGFYVIPLLTLCAVFAAIFRQAFLRRSLLALLLCAAIAMILYETGLFAVCLFLKQTVGSRFGESLMTALVTLPAVPECFPVLLAIGKLGGETWRE